MLVKIIIILFILVILYSLASGLYFLVRDKSNSTRVAKALTWRIGLSLLLFLLLFVGFALGVINPHGV